MPTLGYQALATVMQLPNLAEHTVKGGFRGHINAFVQQVRHDLAGWQLAVGRAVADVDDVSPCVRLVGTSTDVRI